MKKKTKTPAYSAKPGQSETVQTKDYTEPKEINFEALRNSLEPWEQAMTEHLTECFKEAKNDRPNY